MATKKKDEEAEEKPRRPQKSALVMWLEDQWEGWLMSVGSIILFAIAYVLYKFDLVSEQLAGAGFVLAVIFGSLGSVALPAWPLVRSPLQKGLFLSTMLVAASATLYPTMRAAVPPAPLAEVRLTQAQPSVQVKVKSDGPYELAVGGAFKTMGGEAEASYTIKVSGNGSDEVSGSLKRSMQRVRTSRRGGTAAVVQEHTEEKHDLPTVRGGDLTIAAESVNDQLAEGLLIDLRAAPPNLLLFILLTSLALLGATVLDARLVDSKGKVKGYLAVGVAICFGFALRFPEVARPHSLVRPGVEALLVGLIVALGGWLLGAIARLLFGPKIKKAKK
jgi:hypothetical protein